MIILPTRIVILQAEGDCSNNTIFVCGQVFF